MSFRIIQSKHNARLKELRQTLVHPNRVGRTALDHSPSRLVSPCAGIEGLNLLEEALRAGLRVECVFVAQGEEHLLDSVPLATETEILLLPRDLLTPC